MPPQLPNGIRSDTPRGIPTKVAPGPFPTGGAPRPFPHGRGLPALARENGAIQGRARKSLTGLSSRRGSHRDHRLCCAPSLGTDWNRTEAMTMSFLDRSDAGRRLAQRMLHLRGEDVVVLGLPRGGVPVATEVARALGAPLDVILVRKLGVPVQPELGMGAIGEGGVRIINPEVVAIARVTDAEIAAVERRERAELERRARRFRGERRRTPGGPRSSSTTASRPARPRGPPARSRGRREPSGWCWRCRSRRRPRAPP